MLGPAEPGFIDHPDEHARTRIFIRLNHYRQRFFATKPLDRRSNSAQANFLAAIGNLTLGSHCEDDAVLFQLAGAGGLGFVDLDPRLLNEAGGRDEEDEQEHDNVDERNQVQLNGVLWLGKCATKPHAGTDSTLAAKSRFSTACETEQW